MDYARYDSCYIEQLANTFVIRPLQGNPVGFDTEKGQIRGIGLT